MGLRDKITFEPDEELRRFILEYDATNGRMDWPKDKPLGPRIKHYGRKSSNSLAAIRSRQGITQAELAIRTGTTRRNIGAIENMRRTPSVYTAIALADALSVKVEDIFTLEPLTATPPSKH
jgi:DNA-binding XRE family transcriptional regulator